MLNRLISRIVGKGGKTVLLRASLSLLFIGAPTLAAAGASDRIFSNGFDSPMGVVLVGAPGGLAMDALVEYGPIASPAENIVDTVLLDRMDVVLRPQATVGAVNDALAAVGARIASMRPERAAMTLVIPRQGDAGEVRALAVQLKSTGAFRFAFASNESDGDLLPPGVAGNPANRAQITHLLPTRFPAAWNAYRLATRDCESRKVPILIVDYFHPDPPPPFDGILDQIPGFQVDYVEGGRDAYYKTFESQGDLHGYQVVSVLASLFDETNPTGAMPFTRCLNLTGFSKRGLGRDEWFEPALDRVRRSPDNVILSASFGSLTSVCQPSGCQPEDFESAAEELYNSAVATLTWIDASQALWPKLFVSQSGGNARDLEQSAIYPGYGLAPFRSEMSLAGALGSATELVDTRLASLLQSPQYWGPSPGYDQFPSLQLTGEDLQDLTDYRFELGIAEQLAYFPLTRVGATSASARMADLRESFYSNRFPDVSAPADPMFTISGVISFGGTSLATPQVAGLAAYLWLLSPELRAEPALATKIAIEANVDTQVPGLRVIDAYAAALSLDQAVIPTPTSAPVRLATLDLTDDGQFDESDLALFEDQLIANVPPPEERSYNRYDLNGDGATGGPGTARFDLDRVGSLRFGTTNYNLTTQYIGAVTVLYDEAAVTDLDILCYYAFSPLYTGDTGQRMALLGGPCAQSVGAGAGLDFLVLGMAITGQNALLVAQNTDGPGLVYRPQVRRMDLRTRQIGPPEDLAGPAVDPDRNEYLLGINTAVMPNASSRSPVVAYWQRIGETEMVGGATATRIHLFVRYFDPVSQLWDDPAEVGSGLFGSGQTIVARAALDAIGNAMVVWTTPTDTTSGSSRRAVFQSHRDPATRAWSADVSVPIEPITGFARDYGLTAAAGRFTLAWKAVDSSSIRTIQFVAASQAWEPEFELMADATLTSPQLITDNRGHAMALWNTRISSQRYREWVSRFDPDIGLWSAPKDLGDGVVSISGLGGDSLGNAIVLSSLPDFQHAYRRFDVAQLRWDEQRSPAPSPIVPQFAADGNGATLDFEGFVGSQPRDDWASLSLARFSRASDDATLGWQPSELLIRVAGEYAKVWLTQFEMSPDGTVVVFWVAQIRGSDNRTQIVNRGLKVFGPP